MRDIELIPTDELIDELLDRFEHAVFMGIRCDQAFDEKNPKKEAGIHSVRKWIGNSYVCSGLASSLSLTVLNAYAQKEIDSDKDSL